MLGNCDQIGTKYVLNQIKHVQFLFLLANKSESRCNNISSVTKKTTLTLKLCECRRISSKRVNVSTNHFQKYICNGIKQYAPNYFEFK